MSAVAGGDELRTAGDVRSAAMAAVRQRLPAGWTLTQERDPEHEDRGVGAVWIVGAPDGRVARFVVEAKLRMQGNDVLAVREQLQASVRADTTSIGMVAARYLSEPDREKIAAAGLSYADATGNVLLRAAQPGLYLSDRGADRDPWRGPGRPRGTLKGEPAAKVVRALADRAGPWKVRDLVDASRASTGSVYRVMEFLRDEGLLVRTPEGRLEVLDWAGLLRRWSQDYQFAQTNTVTRWIAPRGLAAFLDQVRQAPVDGYAVTGTVAAAAWAPYAPARSAMLYVGDAQATAQLWGLRATDAGVNVLLAQPRYEALLEGRRPGLDGLIIAAPTQVAVDLMTGPGRAPAEAEELLTWMAGHEQSWR